MRWCASASALASAPAPQGAVGRGTLLVLLLLKYDFLTFNVSVFPDFLFLVVLIFTTFDFYNFLIVPIA